MRLNTRGLTIFEIDRLASYFRKRGDATLITKQFNDERQGYDYILHIRGLEVR